MFNATCDFSEHISGLRSKLRQQLYVIRRISSYLDVRGKRIYYFSHIFSRVKYCLLVWCGASKKDLQSLNSLLLRIQELLGILSGLDQIISFYQGLFVFKCLNNQQPKYLCDLVTEKVPKCNHYNTRNGGMHLNDKIYYRERIYGRSPLHRAIETWNFLPNGIRSAPDLFTFKTALKNFLQSNQ